MDERKEFLNKKVITGAKMTPEEIDDFFALFNKEELKAFTSDQLNRVIAQLDIPEVVSKNPNPQEICGDVANQLIMMSNVITETLNKESPLNNYNLEEYKPYLELISGLYRFANNFISSYDNLIDGKKEEGIPFI